MSKLVEQSTANLRTLIIEAIEKQSPQVNCQVNPFPILPLRYRQTVPMATGQPMLQWCLQKHLNWLHVKLRKLSLPILY